MTIVNIHVYYAEEWVPENSYQFQINTVPSWLW